MSLISKKDQETLQKLFEELEGDVTITNFMQRESPLIIPGQECDYCEERINVVLEASVSTRQSCHQPYCSPVKNLPAA